jgi:hypothetical protein
MGPPPDRSECGPIEHSFEPLHPGGHRRMALSGRLVQPVFPSGLTPLAPPAPPHRYHPHTKFAIGMVRQSAENPVTNSSGMNLDKCSFPARGRTWMSSIQTWQIDAGLRYQGRQLGNEVQRRRAAPLEYDVRSPITIRCLSGAAQAGSEYYRWRSAPGASPTLPAGRAHWIDFRRPQPGILPGGPSSTFSIGYVYLAMIMPPAPAAHKDPENPPKLM